MTFGEISDPILIMKYIAARIHNNSLGKVELCDSEADAKDKIRGWAEAQFGRGLNDEEVDSLEDHLEIYNEDDADNLFCFSVGIAE